MTLSGDAAIEDKSTRVLLLADIRDAFSRLGQTQLFTAELLAHLNNLEERPWGEWKSGCPLSGNQLARLLKAFRVHPHSLRDGTKTGKGYKQEDFADTFSRYLSSSDP